MIVCWKLFYIVFALMTIEDHAEATSFLCKQFTEKFITKFYPSVNPNHLQYYFYAKENNKYVSEFYDESNVRKSKMFNPDQKTILIVHGFVNDHNTDWVQRMIRNLLDKRNVNVIAVDWSIVFKITLVNYRESAMKTEKVAESIARFFVKLAEVYNKDLGEWAYLHFMGHSLGAHVVGQAAERLKPYANIHRVTGFDPAKPYFDDEGVHMRLKKSNAQFVDVIHTNSGPKEKTFGLYEALGHIDFYPYGGNKQPVCTKKSRTFHDDEMNKCFSYLFFGLDATGLFTNYVSKITTTGQDILCDHSQGQEYFIQSMVDSSKFVAYKVSFPIEKDENKCSIKHCITHRCVEMGINASRYNDTVYHGTYYLDISSCNKSN